MAAGRRRAAKRARPQNVVTLGVTQTSLFTTNERWLATARGRLGYAADKWLWYVTAGAAWSGFDLNTYDSTVAGAQRQPSRVNKTGWVVGVGTEYALLGGWSVKSEWLYANFGTMHYGDEPGIVNGCVPSQALAAAPMPTSRCTNISGASV